MSRRAPYGALAGRPRGRMRQRGAVMVEVTLVIQLLLMVTFGIVEVGRLMLAYTTLSNAARAGARYAIVHGSYRTGSGIDGPSGPGNTANVATVVHGLTTAAGLPAGSVIITDTVAAPMYPDGTNTVGSSAGVASAGKPLNVFDHSVPKPLLNA